MTDTKPSGQRGIIGQNLLCKGRSISIVRLDSGLLEAVDVLMTLLRLNVKVLMFLPRCDIFQTSL